jgi:hypothetical protein
MTSRRRRSLSATVAVITALAGVCFSGVFGGLAFEMAASRDPALGPKAQALDARHQLPDRRVVRRTVVVRKVHDSGAGATVAPASARPAAAAAAPPAPAPAPAPAPVVTRVS